MCLKRRENNFATSEIEPDNDRRAALRWMGIMEKKEQLNWQQLSRSRMVPAISREQCPGFKKKRKKEGSDTPRVRKRKNELWNS